MFKRELGALLVRDYDFSGALVTVHQVNLTPDLRKAHVYVGIVGNVSPQSVLDTLSEHRKAIQREMAQRVILKYTPVIEFHFDESVARGTRVLHLLDEIDSPDSDHDNPKV